MNVSDFVILMVFAALVIVGLFTVGWLGYRAAGMLWRRRWSEARRLPRALVGATAALVLAAGLWQIGTWAVGAVQSDDVRAIDSLYMRWQRALDDGDWEAAYAMMSPDYRWRWPLQEFRARFGAYGDASLALDPQRRLQVWGSRAWLYPQAALLLGRRDGPELEFVRVDGQWYLSGEARGPTPGRGGTVPAQGSPSGLSPSQ